MKEEEGEGAVNMHFGRDLQAKVQAIMIIDAVMRFAVRAHYRPFAHEIYCPTSRTERAKCERESHRLIGCFLFDASRFNSFVLTQLRKETTRQRKMTHNVGYGCYQRERESKDDGDGAL